MAQHRWDTSDVHVPDPQGAEPSGDSRPGLRRRWAFSLPAAVLAVCLLLGCAAAIVLFRDRDPVPVASIELSPPAADPSSAFDPSAESSGSRRDALSPASATPLPSALPAGPGEPDGGPATTVVHVAGAVQRPGVVRLPPGSRIVDAVEAAGGTAADADLSGVNLAALAEDGAMVLVPRIGENPPRPAGTGGNAAEGGASNAAGLGAQSDGASGSINLNTADLARLQTLPRVGPVLAERIIAWRTEHGRFNRPEDLDAVPGIGEAMMAALLPLVTV
ncbi:helix-hairpin-helix domain-containing protein [Arthrobacter sp. zg-Y895]|uniref:helix-hairpin-helix domain-containing protein n=1 Tax=Arthrobacter sp. zg-Y895 TaxID=2886933 RepID=UPI001D1598D3|nr:helix-hairpin-helix domain-containing protein [Arthrobacter sp. zg-Y895]MCC3301345.1 helix-hairpin-helix domain-containing protein [Arthrobacter sp. zg-Y895]